jgi:hypothetical protein
MTGVSRVGRLRDDELLGRLRVLVRSGNRLTAQLLAHLAEVEARRLFLGQGCASMFSYCTEVLNLSEQAAFNRIQAARAARRYPEILDLVASGSLHLAGVCLLAPHLTDENHRNLIAAAKHQSKRAIEVMLARLNPRNPVASVIRKLPTPRSMSATPPPLHPVAGERSSSQRSSVTPLSESHYRIHFTANSALHEKLCRARDLLRHQIPSGDPAAIIDRALTVLLNELTRKKLAATSSPRESRPLTSDSRHIPAGVKRQVFARDGGRCTFVGPDGRRCAERGFLEFHHIRPFGKGGKSTTANIALLCRAHNQHQAEIDYRRGRPAGANAGARRRLHDAPPQGP